MRRYRENRDLLLAGLPKAGLDRLTVPDGAFYLYADVSHLTNDSREFCRRMLVEAGVATTPGLDFDRQRGPDVGDRRAGGGAPLGATSQRQGVAGGVAGGVGGQLVTSIS